jgi:hypothetical protein
MSVDQIRIMCPRLTCRKILAVPVSSRGKNVLCRNCGTTIRVPDRTAGQAAKAAAAAKDASEAREGEKPAAAPTKAA